MLVATIALPSRVNRALALAESIAEHSPTQRVVIAYLGDSLPAIDAPGNAELKTLADLGIAPDSLTRTRLDPAGLARSLVAPLAAELFQRDDRVLVLADSLLARRPLLPFDDALASADIVVAAQPLATGSSTRSLSNAVVTGSVSTVAIGLRDSRSARDLLADWPIAALAPLERPPSETRDNYRAWFDSLPQREGVKVLPPGTIQDDRGLAGIASSQLPGEESRLTESGEVLIDLDEVAVDRPHLVSASSCETRLGDRPKLARVIASYAGRLIETSGFCQPDPDTKLSDNTPLTPLLRELATDAVARGIVTGDVFSANGLEQLIDWLAQPAAEGASAGLNRYHHALWLERIELQAAYPHLDGSDGSGYAGWLIETRPPEVPMPDRLLPPPPKNHELQVESVDSSPPWGVNVTGLLSGRLGLGEAARWIVDGLDELGVPNLPVQGRLRVPGEQVEDFTFCDVAEAPFAINLVCLNGDTITKLHQEVGIDFFRRRYTIALWWWELSEFPSDWAPAFDLVDEIWVGSEFVRRTIAPISPVPVYRIDLPVRVKPFRKRSRAELDIPDDFVFLNVHDYHSSAARKNPVGLISAFREAFADGSGASLVLKSINGDRLPLEHEATKVAAQGRSDIHLIDGFLEAEDKNALIDSCDCYVSLHRSEGFGQTLAEAMWMAKPVIGTAYGGNVDFMSEANSFPVGHDFSRVGASAGPYPQGAEWAEPDQSQAATRMREVFENPSLAAEKGRCAAIDIRQSNGLEAAEATIARRLEVIYDWINADPVFALNSERQTLRIPRPSSNGSQNAIGTKQMIKHLLHRVDHLTLRRQRAIDDAVESAERRMAATEATLRGEVNRLTRQIEELQLKIAQLGAEDARDELRVSDYQR